MAVRAFVLVAALVAAPTAVACGSFGSSDGGSTGGPVDGSAGVDGSAPGDGSTRADGGSEASSPGACLEVYDPFADLSRWGIFGLGISLDTAVGSAAAPSVSVNLPAAGNARFIEQTFDVGPCLHVAAAIDLEANVSGDGELDLFGVYDPGSTRGVLLVHTASGMYAEVPGVSQSALAFVPGTPFTRVTVDVDLHARTWSVSTPQARTTGAVPADWSASSKVIVRAGFPYAAAASKPWSIHLDDFRLSSKLP